MTNGPAIGLAKTFAADTSATERRPQQHHHHGPGQAAAGCWRQRLCRAQQGRRDVRRRAQRCPEQVERKQRQQAAAMARYAIVMRLRCACVVPFAAGGGVGG